MDIFVSKEEEKALKFEEEVTDLYRMDHNIPDTDGLLEMREEWEKRKRSDTIYTVSSDKPGSKKSKVDSKHIWETYSQQNCDINNILQFKPRSVSKMA